MTFAAATISSVATAFAAALLAGCGDARNSDSPPPTQRIAPDALARIPLPALTFSEPVPPDAPRRIVSMIPSATEVLFALGLGDRIVGRSDWCDWPPEVSSRPALGSQQSMSVERVADLKPDLVVFWAHLPDKAERLSGLFGLQVVTPGTESKDEIVEGIVKIAEACRVPGRGAALVRHLEDGLRAVRERYRSAPPVRTLVVLDRAQVFHVPGRESFLQDAFVAAGIQNVAAELDAGKWPAVSIEQVLDWNPELILDLSLAAEAGAVEVAAAQRYWAAHDTLDAVRSGRVVVLNAGVLVRPGPRLAAVTEALAMIVHGTP